MTKKQRDNSAPAAWPFPDPFQAASMTECTGILPAQVETEEEAESISELESLPPQGLKRKEKKS